jgi:opacity protein-like surface antigen
MRSFHKGLTVAGALALGLVVASSSAIAQDEYTRSSTTTYTETQSDWPSFNRPGPYVGVGGSYIVSGFQDEASRADFGDTLGFNVRGGYRLNEYWAFEGIYEYGDKFGAHQIVPNGEIQTNSFTGNAKLILPLGRFQPYLMAGAGFVNANANRALRRTNWDVDGTNFAGRFGGGVDLYATENVAIYLDTAYTMPINEIGDLYHFSFGWGAKYVF